MVEKASAEGRGTRRSYCRWIGAFASSALTLITVASLCVSARADTTIFGPQTYVRSTGKPVEVKKTFRATQPNGAHTLRVTNHGVTNAVITLNGQRVLAPVDFFGTIPVPVLSRPVTLRDGLNEIIVELRSQPGTSLDVEIDATSTTDTTPPTITASAAPAANANGWNNTEVTVTFSCADAGSGVATCPAAVVASAETPAQVVSGTAVDGAGNTASASVTLKIDKTAPVVSAVASPAANANGWNNGPVLVTFSAADALSGVAAGTVTQPLTLSIDGANLSATGHASDAAGNVGSVTLAGIKIDTEKPSVVVALTPAPNSNGWNNGPVTAHFTCTDAGSGIGDCPPDQTVSTEGASQTIAGTAVDRAGNTASATSAAFNIDLVKPAITFTVSPAPSATGIYVGPVTVHFVCSDAGSGLDVCPPDQLISPPTSGTTGGVTGVASDRAGNSASVTTDPFLIQIGTPAITVALSPAANGAGWRNTPVTVHFTCTENGLPLAGCPADQVVSTEGADQTVTGTVTDAAGQRATVTTDPFSIDLHTPTITVELAPPAMGSGWNPTPVLAHFTCADALSAIATCPADRIVGTDGADQTISGTAIDRAGNTASVTSAPFSIDSQPPTVTVTLTPPPTANGWNTTAVTAHFTCSDAGSGVATCPPDQVLSAEGLNQPVTGAASDRAGNTARAQATVNIDLTPPALTFASRHDGDTLFTPALGIGGSVTDAGSGLLRVTCNGAPATLLGANFSCDVTLTTGANSIVAIATDAAGNTGSATLALNYVPMPKVTITSPANGGYFNISPTTVTGTVDDPTATVTINSIAAPVVGGAFSIALPLAEGPNVVSATATAPGGAVGTASVEVTLDTAPPHVTITSPADGFATAEASISIAGNVNDIVVGTVNDQQARVTVNGGAAQVANRSFLANTVPLAIGANTIQVVATDRVGNAATTQIRVTRQVLTQPQIRPLSGNGQAGVIGSLLPAPLVIELTDGLGHGIPGKPVIFKVTQNDGLLTAGGDPAVTVIATTDAQGKAQARWTLGQRAGAGGNVAEAYSVGFEGTAIYTATATQGTAGKIVIDTGNDQIGAIAQPLPKPFIAVVVDDGNNRLANVPVTFTVRQGGGSFAGQPAVTVDSDSDGRVAATLDLGLQEGSANNLVEATFQGNAGSPAAFTASGRAPGNPAQTSITGVVLDNSNIAVPGVTVRAVLTNVVRSNLGAVQAATAVRTDSQGQFTIPQAPVGLIKLMIDGTTALRQGTYPSLEYDLVTVAGQKNDVGQPIYILPLSTANQLCVTETTGGGTLTVAEAPGFSLTFAPGQVTFPGGTKTGCVSVTVVNGDKVPMVPGFGQQPRFIVTIQPSGATFNPPAPITLPNVDGLKPRAVTEMYSFDHDIGSFVAIGTGVVSDDGRVIRSGAGVGVLKAGWHCGGDPNTTGTAATCPTCQTCNGTQCQPDDGQSPSQTPNDCRKDKCQGGGIVSVNDDNDHDADSCCYNGSSVGKQPIADLSQCPNRVAGPWTYQYDGCSLQPLPGFFRNNPAGGFSTLFSDDHLSNPTHQYACDEHDRCYQTCAGNDLTGGQEGCDQKLRNIALTQCAKSLLNPLDLLSGASERCFAFAVAYYEGLSTTGIGLGKGAYADRQKQVCQCCQ